MMNLGDVPAGSVLYVPFATYNSSGASVTISGLAVTDIEIYKNGSVTQRSSDAGYALLDTDGIDFDGITGIHGFSVDLADNTDSGFFAAGAAYFLVVSAITVDSQTVNFVYYFTIDRANVLRPTTAGRTLDVASTGEAGIDFGNVLLPAGAIPALGITDNGTAQSATSTTLVLRSAAAYADDTLIGGTILITGGTLGVGQTALITDYTGSTDTATISAWSGGVTPTGTITYVIFGTAPSSGGSGPTASAIADEVQTRTIAAVTTVTNLTNAPTAGDLTATMKTSIGTAVAASAVASVTGNVGGNVAGSVGSVTGAVGSVTGNVGGNVAGSVGSVTGLTAADVGAIKAKTDSLAFTVTGQVDANTKSMNDAAVLGVGTSGDKWRGGS